MEDLNLNKERTDLMQELIKRKVFYPRQIYNVI